MLKNVKVIGLLSVENTSLITPEKHTFFSSGKLILSRHRLESILRMSSAEMLKVLKSIRVKQLC